jgi:hypothetical protein
MAFTAHAWQAGTDTLMRIPCVITHVEADGPPDEYGDPTETSTTTPTRCYLAQRSRTEMGLTPVEVDRWSLYLPAGTKIDGNDTVGVMGGVFQVIGEPWPVIHPLTLRVNHIEATLERRR